MLRKCFLIEGVGDRSHASLWNDTDEQVPALWAPQFSRGNREANVIKIQ